MSSFEEEKLMQMVHDFIESDTPATPISTPLNQEHTCFTLEVGSLCSVVYQVQHRHLCFIMLSSLTCIFSLFCGFFKGILGSSTDAEREVFEKAMKHVREMGDERNSGSVKKRLMMRLRMDGYDASLCRSSWVATWDCPGGENLL